MAAAVRDLPALDEPESVLAALSADEAVHKTHAAEFERFDLDALSRQLKTKLAARTPEADSDVSSSSNELSTF